MQIITVTMTIVLMFSIVGAYPTLSSPYEDDRSPEIEYANPGAHQLASWLTAQLRRNDYVESLQRGPPVPPYRLLSGRKRNSELTNSMMGIPRDMINNGRK